MSANLAEKVAQYPALAEMGIIRFHEISHYSLRQDGADKDVLRVMYKRAKGSLLPFSRKYKFGRSVKTVIADGGTSRMEQTYEISPFLLKAVAELDELVRINNYESGKSGSTELKSDLLAEISELQGMLDRSVVSDSLPAINEKIDILRKHVKAL